MTSLTPMIRNVVFDIEGTVCPISFVKETLFPYAIKRIHEIVPKLENQFPLTNTPTDSAHTELLSYLQKFPDEYKISPQGLLDHIDDLTQRDVKAPYLKSLQGYLWKSGYESGEIKAPLFSDAISAIEEWPKILSERNGGIWIYSSGSVPAQILLFRHVDATPTDMTPNLKGYFDTVNAGPKTEAPSYDKIASDIGGSSNEILFFSDNPLEIKAAKLAGWNAITTMRPGNAPLPSDYSERVVEKLDNSLIE
jgi:enolase-phosphatase E1